MVLFSIKKLFDLCNPFNNPPWDELQGQSISFKEIGTHFTTKTLYRPKKYCRLNPETKAQHINRIAWYIKRGWGQSTITANFNFFPGWCITDGTHRFSAAIIRGDEFICGNWEGNLETAKEFFYV